MQAEVQKIVTASFKLAPKYADARQAGEVQARDFSSQMYQGGFGRTYKKERIDRYNITVQSRFQ